MNLEERISLLSGVDTWHTPATSEVPAIRMSDGPAGVRGTRWDGPASASFPCGAALAASFDPALVREVGQALAREARSKSAHVLLGPTVNLQRTPVGGRNFECVSEDPVLTAAIASGGSTLRDAQYVDLFGDGGSYQDDHRVYGRAGERCVTCGRGWVRRIVVGQRSTHFCPICQR